MTAARLRKYRIAIRGARGLSLTIPTQQARDMGVGLGDELSMYTCIMAGKPIIILANSDAPALNLNDEQSQQGRDLAAVYASAQGAAV